MAQVLPRTPRIAAFDHLHHVPVLYARAAEFNAVGALYAPAYESLTPLWVIPPIPTEPRSGRQTKTLEKHVSDTVQKLRAQWGERAAFVDCHQLRDEVAADGSMPAKVILDAADALGMQLVPVVRDDSTVDEVEAIVEWAEDHGTDLGLRLSSTMWAEIGTPTGDAALADIISMTRTGVQFLHLIMDLGDQVASPPNMSAVAVRAAVAALPDLSDWRTLTVLGTSMPATTAGVGRDRVAELPRAEWALWKLVRDSARRKMSYGDYAIQSVDLLSTYNPLTMQTAAQLRYTISTSWVVARGSSTRINGFGQSARLSREISRHSEFSGAAFSWGDNWIVECAAGRTGTGNPTTWRGVTTNHHLQYVASQLAALRGP